MDEQFQAEQYINSFVLPEVNDSLDDILECQEALSDIKKREKLVAEKKDSILRPAKQTVKAVNELFSPVEKLLKQTTTVLKDRLSYLRKELNEKRVEKISEYQESGDEESKAIAVSCKAVSETIKTRKKAILVVDDWRVSSNIPLEYVKLDEKAILSDLKEGKEIPGCHLGWEEIILNVY